DPGKLESLSQATIVRHVEAMLALRERGAVVFDYGNNIRPHAASGGLPEELGHVARIAEWIELARRHVPRQGLPARIAWLGHGERTALGLAANAAVASGRLRGPVAFSRDHM